MKKVSRPIGAPQVGNREGVCLESAEHRTKVKRLEHSIYLQLGVLNHWQMLKDTPERKASLCSAFLQNNLEYKGVRMSAYR